MRPDVPLYCGSLPAPSGWYCVGLVAEFPKGAVVTKRLAGRDVVVFRGDDMRFGALDAYCPHLGAHMGEGGRVEGDSVRCPFHGFCFDADGTCTRTAYGTRPPTAARARAYPVQAIDGVVLVYFHARAVEPTWQPEGADGRGWSPFRMHLWTLRGHPQETTENSVDIGHFAVVHGYEQVHERSPTLISGPHLFARYGFARPSLRLLGRAWSIREEIDVHVWGLGYSRVEVRDLTIGLDLRLLVLPTPLDGDRIELRVGLSVRDFVDSTRLAAIFRRVPRSLTGGPLAHALLRLYRQDLERDFAIWKHKRYVETPPLASGDGPVGMYRRWVRQFYDGVRADDP